MSVLLPTTPSPTDGTEPSYLDWGGTLRPIFGGSLQKLRRLGDRFALSVVMPPMFTAEAGMLWVARLIAARRAGGAVLPWPQPGFTPPPSGAPRVAGAGQSGSLLTIEGFSPVDYVVREGQFFSIIHGGRRYLHQAAESRAAVDGRITALAIQPMLRISPANLAVCEFDEPKIEGMLGGDEQTWTPSTARTIGLTFSITETK
jgi:hypothetical protein